MEKNGIGLAAKGCHRASLEVEPGTVIHTLEERLETWQGCGLDIREFSLVTVMKIWANYKIWKRHRLHTFGRFIGQFFKGSISTGHKSAALATVDHFVL